MDSIIKLPSNLVKTLSVDMIYALDSIDTGTFDIYFCPFVCPLNKFQFRIMNLHVHNENV